MPSLRKNIVPDGVHVGPPKFADASDQRSITICFDGSRCCELLAFMLLCRRRTIGCSRREQSSEEIHSSGADYCIAVCDRYAVRGGEGMQSPPPRENVYKLARPIPNPLSLTREGFFVVVAERTTASRGTGSATHRPRHCAVDNGIDVQHKPARAGERAAAHGEVVCEFSSLLVRKTSAGLPPGFCLKGFCSDTQ
jgi:hypothetical protein